MNELSRPNTSPQNQPGREVGWTRGVLLVLAFSRTIANRVPEWIQEYPEDLVTVWYRKGVLEILTEFCHVSEALVVK